MQVQSRENTRQLSPRARSLWAKTGAEEMRHRFSPLYVHMSDSGQTMRHLWREWLPVSIKQLVTRNLELDEVSAENTLAWLAAVHDIGKATPGFQCKNSDLAERVEEQGLPIPADMNAGHVKHAVMGQIILERWIARRGWAQVYKGDTRPAERTYAVVIGGHHGAPPSASEYNDYKKPLKQKYFGGEEWQAVQLELLEWAWNTTGASAAEKRLQVSSLSPQTQMIVTGLVIMTDWIASNTDYFPLINSLNSEEEAERRGADAWRRLSLPASWKAIPPQRDSETLFHCRFPKLPDEARLRPVQEMALKVSSQAEKPCMIIIEAPMGNGKTEASL